jgi:hypothetical protein
MTDDDYREKVDKLRNQFESRIKAILARTARAFDIAKLKTTEPDELSDACYRWSFGIKTGQGDEDWIDFSFFIAESKEYDGSLDGINFMTDMVAWGGECVGGISPYNYTPDVWVDLDDEDAIEERFRILENADENDAVAVVKDWLKIT